MLQHDGHFFGILLAQAIGNPHALRARVEGDEEMMVAGQAACGDVGEHLAHDAAQRVLGEQVVADEVESWTSDTPIPGAHATREKVKVEASVARCLRTPPESANRSGLNFGISNRLRGLSNRSIVVIRNYGLAR